MSHDPGVPTQIVEATLERDLAQVLNRYSQEHGSNTPDWILAQYLLGCLAVFHQTVKAREVYYGMAMHPGVGPVPIKPHDPGEPDDPTPTMTATVLLP